LGAVANVSKIVLAPKVATNEITTTCSWVAAVTNTDNQPVSNVRVDFLVEGTNSLTGFAYSDQNGQARFTYTGTNLGADTVSAFIGTNTDVATNIWTLPHFILHGNI